MTGQEMPNGSLFGRAAAGVAGRNGPGGVELDEEQRAFVEFQEGCAVLHAPVGTGKTLALAERAAEAIRRGVEPSRILCLTFTNRAADELRQRVAVHCGDRAKRVVVRTFHGLCAWMLRLEAKRIGLPSDFTIFDDEDSAEILRSNLRRAGDGVSRGGDPPRVVFAPAHSRFDREPKASDIYEVIERAKSEAPHTALSVGAVADDVFQGLPPAYRELAVAYQRELASNHAFDFGDLVYFTRAMLALDSGVRGRWEARFSMVQVDEMQDTHFSEYEIVRALARRSRNLVLAGDFDQTIYEWRGSMPDKVLSSFRADFPGARDFSFTQNHRATRVLVDLAGCVAREYSARTVLRPGPSAEAGDPVIVHFGGDSEAEADWIARKIRTLAGSEAGGGRVPYGRIGVLTRTNSRGTVISEAFQKRGIPHLTVETYEFFRRQEVKDAVAYLRFLCSPADGRSFRRILQRPPRNIGDRTISRVLDAEQAGLRLVDMVAQSTRATGDPFGMFLAALGEGVVTVFDTETTGLDPASDEIVELAAVRLEKGKPAGRFHRYLRNMVSVGESENVHGLSDSFLASNGEDPRRALEEFDRFASGSVLVGHNVGFDARMLAAYRRRLGLRTDGRAEYIDTLEMARRFLDGDDFSLAALARRLNVAVLPTHRAVDDVEATCGVVDCLAPLVRATAPARIRAVRDVGAAFAPLAQEVARLRRELGRLRPHELLDRVLNESGLREYYKRDPESARRLANLEELLRIFKERDSADLDALSSVESILGFVALARNVDRLDPNDERVRVLTVHQAKGLEFDIVFVAGLSEYEFPSYLALRERKGEEERRVFYVAITRARKALFLTGHAANNGKPRGPSPYFAFLAWLGKAWHEEGSTGVTKWIRSLPRNTG
ncbi:MAG: 3'-5' exonuclease [Betaproteobacteria bacterium]